MIIKKFQNDEEEWLEMIVRCVVDGIVVDGTALCMIDFKQ